MPGTDLMLLLLLLLLLLLNTYLIHITVIIITTLECFEENKSSIIKGFPREYRLLSTTYNYFYKLFTNSDITVVLLLVLSLPLPFLYHTPTLICVNCQLREVIFSCFQD